MALEICAMLAALYCAAFTPETSLAGDTPVEPAASQTSSRTAEPCLVHGRRCLDLSEAPFTLCLASPERCKPDVKFRKLLSSAGERPSTVRLSMRPEIVTPHFAAAR